LDTGNRRVYLKIESGLPTGSFKVRGAVYAMSRHVERNGTTPVIAASTGNHGAAVAYAGQLLNVPVTIFLPERANPIKTRRILDLGARLVATGPDLSAAIDAAYAEADRTGAFFLHDATDPDIPAGTATIGTEIVTQLPAADAIFVPMGDTALIRGVAAAAKQLKPSIRIVGVAAANAPAYVLSWHGGDAVSTDTAHTIADGLAVRRALAPNVAAITTLVDDVRLVEEEELLATMAHLSSREHVIAEPAAAAATAALMKDPDTTGTNVALVTGKNARRSAGAPAEIRVNAPSPAFALRSARELRRARRCDPDHGCHRVTESQRRADHAEPAR
jgi:threonine dehydratase